MFFSYLFNPITKNNIINVNEFHVKIETQFVDESFESSIEELSGVEKIHILFYLSYHLIYQQVVAKIDIKDISMFQKFRHMNVILNKSSYFYLTKEYLKHINIQKHHSLI